MISIVIATKNRTQQIISCIESIKRSTYRSIGIIVCDQSDTQETKRALANSSIEYITVPFGGKSAALNQGIYKARGNIIAFTDDDCVVSKNWLSEIHRVFNNSPEISAVFGRTLPFQTHKHHGQNCPCIFTNRVSKMTIKPCLHYQRIGFGNNMAIRASVLREIGRFKEWLGPGSIGGNAEDAEIALRMLVKGYKILYNPNMLVYHNKWLNNKEMKKQNLSYICGEMACYGYFHFHGRRFASPVIRSNLRDSYHGFRQIIKRIVSLRWSFALLTDTYGEFLKVVYRVRGLLVARYFSLVDPIR